MRLLCLLLAWAGCAPAVEPHWEAERNAMVDTIANYSPELKVTDARVLAAMRKVPRHEFVPEASRPYAYADTPLPIGEGQTISQPLIVGYMTELLRLKGGERVLEIGTGSGYQAAVLAELVKEVDTIEIVEALARRAQADLRRLGYKNVRVRAGDGYRGWPERAPYDAIVVTCGAEKIPPALLEQLKAGGRLVIPVGPDLDKKPWANQRLLVVTKTAQGTTTERLIPVRFVPMTGEVRERR